MWNDSTDWPTIVTHVSFLAHITIVAPASLCSENCAMSFDPIHRVFIVESYFHEILYSKVIQQFSEKFPRVMAPNKSTIKRTIDQFCNHYMLANWKCSHLSL